MILLLFNLLMLSSPLHADSTLELYADTPAKRWESGAYPIGNGRLGAMLFEGLRSAQVQFNVDSLWTGDENPSGLYNEKKSSFGAYQNFGSLFLELDGMPKKAPAGYSRRLDLRRSLHTTKWQGKDGTRYLRETFASHPAEVIAIRLTATGPSKLNGQVRFVDAHQATPTVQTKENALAEVSFSGKLSNGLRYYAAAQLQQTGGKVEAKEGALFFVDCQTITLYLSADTDYAMNRKSGWRGTDPAPRVSKWLAAAARLGWTKLQTTHEADYRSLMGRVKVNFGKTAPKVLALSTAMRIKQHSAKTPDPELEAMLFQYGRYLLISSSRTNGLPANLQGLWNNSNTPPWRSDYHTNINEQMNYWLAEPANLSECHLPLLNLLDATLPVCTAATQAAFGVKTPGFTYRTSHNIFGGQGWKWNKPASAWLSMHYWEHYAFSGDETFLRQNAWPYLQGACKYWLHDLKETPDGYLIAPRGWSPEHGPVVDGVTHDQQLIEQLFSNTLAAAKVLKIESPFVNRVATTLRKLQGPKIGKWGQLQEWLEDRDNPKDQHRHTSHLVGVYPGSLISTTDTPKLAAAAVISLRARGDVGDSRRSWTWPWRCALWARLQQPKDCHRMIDGLLRYNTLSNLITTHAPLQLDGSFGITAGMCEMLLQSHAGELRLLPGVDLTRWPTGAYQGLRARGGFVVSVQWKKQQLTNATITSTLGGPLQLDLPQKRTLQVVDSKGNPVPTKTTESGAHRWETQTGEHYQISFGTP